MFGGIKKSAQAEIAAKELLIAKQIEALEDLSRQGAGDHRRRKAEHDAKQGKFKAEKDPGPQDARHLRPRARQARRGHHQGRARLHRQSPRSRSRSCATSLGGIEGQADKLVKINSQMITVVADPRQGHRPRLHGQQGEGPGAVDAERTARITLGRLERERKKNDFERHVTALLDSGRGTKKTVADLEKDAVDANTFHDALGKQNVNLRELSSDGIASVATSLNTTIQALNNSALNEASESVRDSMRAMNAVTDDVANKEVIRQALQVDEASKRIVEKVESMSNIAESLQAANKLREDGLSNIQSRLGELSDVTATVRARLQESIGHGCQGSRHGGRCGGSRSRSTTRRSRSGRSEPGALLCGTGTAGLRRSRCSLTDGHPTWPTIF